MARRIVCGVVLALFVALGVTSQVYGFACGNGIQEPGEECDDGNTMSGDGCSAACTIEACPIAGIWASSTPGIVDAIFNLREDTPGVVTGACVLNLLSYGNVSLALQVTGTRAGNTVTLTADGFPLVLTFGDFEDCGLFFWSLNIAGVLMFDGTAHFVTADRCGDGVQEPSEQCDDGNLNAGDGCNPVCVPERCGNRIVEASEQCDDGNTFNGDGCEADCTTPRCGNGIVDSGEQCDDGNLTPGDGCDQFCGIPGCPNGHVDPGEDCDDGNLIDSDGCARNCSFQGCGNFVLEPGELCDDGNTLDDDGCPSDCGASLVTTTTTTTSSTTSSSEAGTTSTTTTTTSSTTTSQPPVCADADGDGEADATDKCPGTMPGAEVDDGGCSLDQFCSGIDVSTPLAARLCKKADWKNDEPIMRHADRDCMLDRGARGSDDDRCVPAQ